MAALPRDLHLLMNDGGMAISPGGEKPSSAALIH